jgi:hypothetical protein
MQIIQRETTTSSLQEPDHDNRFQVSLNSDGMIVMRMYKPKEISELSEQKVSPSDETLIVLTGHESDTLMHFILNLGVR